MTQQEIQERSEQIALMLGWSLITYPTHMKTPFHGQAVWWSDTSSDGKTRTFCCINGEEFFHLDWNWLMEAVEKILQIVSQDDDMETYHTIIDQIPDIEAVFIAVSDFAKLYNEKKL